MTEQPHICGGEPGEIEDFADAGQNALGGILRRRRNLVKDVIPAFDVNEHQIGEGSAGIDPNPNVSHALSYSKGERILDTGYLQSDFNGKRARRPATGLCVLLIPVARLIPGYPPC